MTGKKKVLVVCLAGARSILRPEKKVLVVCLAGARSLLRPEKKILVVCLAGAQSLLRLEKKSSSIVFGVTYILSVQCTVVLLCQFFGCSRK